MSTLNIFFGFHRQNSIVLTSQGLCITSKSTYFYLRHIPGVVSVVVRRKHFDKNHCFSIFIPIWTSMKFFFVNLISQN